MQTERYESVFRKGDRRRWNVITEKKDQELETASVTLAEGMHFDGAIDSFHH